MAAGRVVSRAVEPSSGFYPIGFFFLSEVVMAALHPGRRLGVT